MAADAAGCQDTIVASAPVRSQREGLSAVGGRQKFIEFIRDIRGLHSGAGASGQRKLVGLIVAGALVMLGFFNDILEFEAAAAVKLPQLTDATAQFMSASTINPASIWAYRLIQKAFSNWSQLMKKSEIRIATSEITTADVVARPTPLAPPRAWNPL